MARTRKAQRRRAPRRHPNPLIELDKIGAELIFGPAYGRPTISRHIGRGIANTFGTNVGTGVDVFHGVLILGTLAYLGSRTKGALPVRGAGPRQVSARDFP